MSTVAKINEEYFGNDKSKNYLIYDLSKVLQGIIQRDIILNILDECPKARHYKKYKKEKNGNESISRGDFDPDNAGILSFMFTTYEQGLMVNVRQLLTDKENGAGGKFIKDIKKFSAEDFIKSYQGGGKGKIPRLLVGKFIHSKNVKGTDFIEENRSHIEKTVNELIKKAEKFCDKGYFNQIVKPYEALKFHKDRQPEKHDVHEEVEEIGSFKINKTTRKDKAQVNITEIAKCLNEFSEIVKLYWMLSGESMDLSVPFIKLEDYVGRTFSLFAKKVPEDVKKKTTEDIIKYLHQSLDVVSWRHDN